MSVGVGKGWRRWRNQAGAGSKQAKQANELKERFGHRSDLTRGKFRGAKETKNDQSNRIRS